MDPTGGAAVGTTLDYGIILAYFVAVLGFGTLFGRHTRTTKDFFFGGQRFSWWIVAFSLVATTVGSYSFIKYARVAYTHGLASTMSYTNDWFWMPALMFVWLPIVFYSRVTSVPEYFERRFDRRVRLLTTVLMLLYLLGYIGINLLTMGVALKAMLGWNLYAAAAVVAVICGVYVTAGGQTSVIMTDLLQGFLLLGAGFLLFWLGTRALGGVGEFWSLLDRPYRLPLNYFNEPPGFNFIGIFWQDGISNSMFAYFLNQGMIMRFLAARSPREGRRALVFLLLVLQLLAAVAVSNAGWIGRAMVAAGLLPEGIDPQSIFVVVAEKVCQPGVFGFVMAALTAALMSTADTLLNATSAVAVNDLYRTYVRPGATDKQALAMARAVSIGAAAIGLASVPLFASFESIYAAHGAFTAMMTPPMAAALLMGAFWQRFNTPGALATIAGGAVAIGLSLLWPDLIAPFSFGVPRGGEGIKAWSYQRAAYGVSVSFAIGIVVTLFTRPPDRDRIAGLVWGTIDTARRRFKGGEPSRVPGQRLLLEVEVGDDPGLAPADYWDLPDPPPGDGIGPGAPPRLHRVFLAAADRERMLVAPGDIVFLEHPRRIYGGLRALRARVGDGEALPGMVVVSRDALASGGLEGCRHLRAEKLL